MEPLLVPVMAEALVLLRAAAVIVLPVQSSHSVSSTNTTINTTAGSSISWAFSYGESR